MSTALSILGTVWGKLTGSSGGYAALGTLVAFVTFVFWIGIRRLRVATRRRVAA